MKRSIVQLHGSEDANIELKRPETKTAKEQEQAEGQKLLDVNGATQKNKKPKAKFDSTIYKMLIYCFICMSTMTFSGALTIGQYVTTIMRSFNFPLITSQIFSVVVMTVRLLGQVSGAFIMKKIGRTSSILMSSVSTAVITALLAFVTLFMEESLTTKIAIIVLICCAMYMLCAGAGSVAWCIPGELLMTEYKATGQLVVSMTFASELFILAFLFPIAKEMMGDYVFLVFTGMNVVFAVWVKFRGVETKEVRAVDTLETFKNRNSYI